MTAVTHLLITKHILKPQEYVVSVMLICVRNLELTYELHKAIKLNFIDARNDAVVRRVSKHFTLHAPSRPYCNRDVRADSIMIHAYCIR